MRHTEESVIKRFVSRIEFAGKSCFVSGLRYLKCETDILHISNDLFTHEYEVKTDVGRFLAEKNKGFWRNGKRYDKFEQTISGFRVNYFTYIFPISMCKDRYIKRIHPSFGIIGYEEPTNSVAMKFTHIRAAKILKETPITVKELLLITERAAFPKIQRRYIEFMDKLKASKKQQL